MVTYGYSVKENDDHYIEVVNAMMAGLIEVTTPGAFIVELIPSCEIRSPSSVAGDTNCSYLSFTLIRSTPQSIHDVDPFIPALRPSSLSSWQCDMCPTGFLGQDGK